ncbi:MAG: PQQ-binding-like beta-propeller repeat protein [Planctomycetes bacterium]|nr:PQQ-binding-like beta-propeller repeat protein [Planctomycetota bacterium]
MSAVVFWGLWAILSAAHLHAGEAAPRAVPIEHSARTKMVFRNGFSASFPAKANPRGVCLIQWEDASSSGGPARISVPERRLDVVDPSTGKRLWTVPSVFGPGDVQVDGDIMYVDSHNKKLKVVDVMSGQLRETIDLPANPILGWRISDAGLILLTSSAPDGSNREWVGFNLKEKRELWRKPYPKGAAGGYGHVGILAKGWHLEHLNVVVDPETGKEVFALPGSPMGECQKAIKVWTQQKEGRPFVGFHHPSTGALLWAQNPETEGVPASQEWSARQQSVDVSTQDVVAVSTLASGKRETMLRDISNGAVLWKFPDVFSDIQGPTYALLEGMVVAVLGADRRFTALDRKTGKVMWTRAIGEQGAFSFFAKKDIVVVAEQSFVHGLDPTSGKVVWSLALPLGVDVSSGVEFDSAGDLLAVCGRQPPGVVVLFSPDPKLAESDKVMAELAKPPCGTLRWQWRAPSKIGLLDGSIDGSVFVQHIQTGTPDSRGLDAKSGAQRSHPLGDPGIFACFESGKNLVVVIDNARGSKEKATLGGAGQEPRVVRTVVPTGSTDRGSSKWAREQEWHSPAEIYAVEAALPIVFTATADGLFAVDSSKKNTLAWKSRQGTSVTALAHRAKEGVLFGAAGANLVGWKTKDRKESFTAPLVEAGSRVIRVSDDGKTIAALLPSGAVSLHSASNGKELWKKGDLKCRSFALGQKEVVVLSEDGALACFAVGDGKQVWSTAVKPTSDPANVPLVCGDVALLGIEGQRFQAFKLSDGKPGWSYRASQRAELSTLAARGDLVLVSRGGSCLLAFDAKVLAKTASKEEKYEEPFSSLE